MSIHDLRERASKLVERDPWDYLETGTGHEVSLDEAEKAWQSWRFRPRVLRDVSTVSTATTLLGVDLSTPVAVAPTAYHEPYHRDGECGTAAGVRAAGSLMCLSTRSSRPLEQVAEVAGPWWMQVYVSTDRAISEAMVGRAVDAGASALVLTGDTPYVSRRTRSRGVPVSNEVARANVSAQFVDREWADLDENRAITVSDIAGLSDASGLPVLVKGVLRADDALACVEAGAAGVVVSNHGARQVDRAVPTAYALREVVDAVGDQVPVIVDGGIRTGHDVVTALALGADAVFVGRPTIYALACGGADGVAQMLQDLTEETAQVMGLLGARSLAELDRSLVVRT